MKTKNRPNLTRPQHHPTDDEIRDYAFHLYELSGRIPGRDLENWLEAKACLEARIPQHRAHLRLKQNPGLSAEIGVVVRDAEGFLVLDDGDVTGDPALDRGLILVGAPPP